MLDYQRVSVNGYWSSNLKFPLRWIPKWPPLTLNCPTFPALHAPSAKMGSRFQTNHMQWCAPTSTSPKSIWPWIMQSSPVKSEPQVSPGATAQKKAAKGTPHPWSPYALKFFRLSYLNPEFHELDAKYYVEPLVLEPWAIHPAHIVNLQWETMTWIID